MCGTDVGMQCVGARTGPEKRTCAFSLSTQLTMVETRRRGEEEGMRGRKKARCGFYRMWTQVDKVRAPSQIRSRACSIFPSFVAG